MPVLYVELPLIVRQRALDSGVQARPRYEGLRSQDRDDVVGKQELIEYGIVNPLKPVTVLEQQPRCCAQVVRADKRGTILACWKVRVAHLLLLGAC